MFSTMAVNSSCSGRGTSSDVILEPLRRHPVMSFVNAGVGIQPVVDHDPVYKIIDDDGDVVHATEPVVERGFDLALHILSLLPVFPVSWFLHV